MISDMSKNLFERAIAFSGTAFDPWVVPPNINFAERLGRVLGFNGTTEAELLDFLERAPAADLVTGKLAVTTPEEKYGKLLEVSVGPVVEPSWSKNPFLTKDPVIAARTAWSNDIDAIFSLNSFEGLFEAFRELTGEITTLIDTFNGNSVYYAPLLNPKFNQSSPQTQVYGQRTKELYLNSTTLLSSENILKFYEVTI
jgi:carboxylesterase type B